MKEKIVVLYSITFIITRIIHHINYLGKALMAIQERHLKLCNGKFGRLNSKNDNSNIMK